MPASCISPLVRSTPWDRIVSKCVMAATSLPVTLHSDLSDGCAWSTLQHPYLWSGWKGADLSRPLSTLCSLLSSRRWCHFVIVISVIKCQGSHFLALAVSTPCAYYRDDRRLVMSQSTPNRKLLQVSVLSPKSFYPIIFVFSKNYPRPRVANIRVYKTTADSKPSLLWNFTKLLSVTSITIVTNVRISDITRRMSRVLTPPCDNKYINDVLLPSETPNTTPVVYPL